MYKSTVLVVLLTIEFPIMSELDYIKIIFDIKLLH